MIPRTWTEQGWRLRRRRLGTMGVLLLSVAAPATAEESGTRRSQATAAEGAGSEKDERDEDELTTRADQIARYLSDAFANETETRSQRIEDDSRKIADRVEHVLSRFVDIGGYFRAGYGRDGKGGPMPGFQAPGATTKYRLGNEAENYGELIVGKNFYLPGAFRVDPKLRPDGTPAGPIARVQLRMNFFNPYSEHSTAGETSVGLPEAWASIGNVIPGMPGAKFWAGSRFYRRHDIHVTDFFFWDMSGGGGGVEDVDLGFGQLAFAWIGLGSTSGLSYLPQPEPENQAGFSKSNWDLRLYDVHLLGGNAELGVVFSIAESGLDPLGRAEDSTQGAAVHLVHEVPELLSEDGRNKFSIQFGTGPARTFTAGFETETIGTDLFVVRNDPSAWRLRVTESFTASPARWLSLSPIVVAQLTNDGQGEPSKQWYSAGLRPQFHFTEYLNLALEAGIDWVSDPAMDRQGSLRKLTIAPQVSVGRKFLSRPVVRAFATFASWDDALVGEVGGLDYASDHHGVSWGMQMEAWW